MTVDIASLTDADGTVRYTAYGRNAAIMRVDAAPGSVALIFKDRTSMKIIRFDDEFLAGDMRMFAHALLAAAEYAP